MTARTVEGIYGVFDTVDAPPAANPFYRDLLYSDAAQFRLYANPAPAATVSAPTRTTTTSTSRIISLSGYAQSGKDTIAKVLVEEKGFTRVAFADALRDCCYALNPWIPVQDRWYSLQTIVDLIGWERAKTAYPHVRELLQRMGTEAGRAVIDANVWVQAAMRKIDDASKVVVTDTRFPNEYNALRERGALMVQVTRPGVAAVNAHVSDSALDGYTFDKVISNEGSLSELRAKALRLAG